MAKRPRGPALNPFPIGGNVLGPISVPVVRRTAVAAPPANDPKALTPYDHLLDAIARAGGISRADAELVHEYYRKEKILGRDGKVKHGAFMERDVIQRALAKAKEEAPTTKAAPPAAKSVSPRTMAPAPSPAQSPTAGRPWTAEDKAQFQSDYEREMRVIRAQRADDEAFAARRGARKASAKTTAMKAKIAGAILAVHQAHIGNSVGEFVAGAARQPRGPVQTGPRGGKFIVSASGKRWYPTNLN